MSGLKKLLIAIVLASAFTNNVSYAQSANDPQIYIARAESPSEVMSYLLGLYGRELKGSSFSSQPVSGKFVVKSVADVMAYFERSYKIGWFEYGSTVYVYRPEDWSSRSIYVGDYSASTNWDEIISNAGLSNKKFNVFYSSQTKELKVSGPREYIRIVRSLFEVNRPPEEKKPEPKPEEKDPEFMIFQLKYASVDDRVITFRDGKQKYTTPGVLSILKTLLGGSMGVPFNGNDNGLAAYGLDGMKLSALTDPRTAVQAAGALVEKSVRGTESRNSIYPGAAPTLGPNRQPNQPGQDINIPAVSAGGGSTIFADARTNSIIIKDIPEKYSFYKSVIDRLDVPVPMIEVEAMLVEIDSSSLNQLGVEFGLNTGTNSKVQFNFPAVRSRVSPDFPGLGATSIVDPAKFVARLQALAANSSAKVLSRPTIVTQDNVPAFIDLSETLFLQVKGERVAEVKEVTAGSSLQVTPRLVVQDGKSEIFVSIEIQDGAIQNLADSNSNPSVRNTTLNTQALIDKDKAILIGGYNRETSADITNKIPILGDIPFIGVAFSSVEKSTKNFVRMFLITPRILTEPKYLAQSTRDAVGVIKDNFKGVRSNSLSVPEPIQVFNPDVKLQLDPVLTK
jgi:type III secretion protein C